MEGAKYNHHEIDKRKFLLGNSDRCIKDDIEKKMTEGGVASEVLAKVQMKSFRENT